MPTYLYKCKKCGKEFEYSQRMTDEPLEKCPIEVCEEEDKGQGDVFRKISKNIGLVFNGRGFYLTDYVFKIGKNGNSPSHSKVVETSKSEKTETKPETKSTNEIAKDKVTTS